MTPVETTFALLAISVSFGGMLFANRPKTYNLCGQSYFFRPLNLGAHGCVLVRVPGLHQGDFVLLRNGEQGARYLVLSVHDVSLEGDLFQLMLVFDGRRNDQPISYNRDHEKAYASDVDVERSLL